MVVIRWLVDNIAGNLIVDSLFSIPAAISFIRLHRKMKHQHGIIAELVSRIENLNKPDAS